MRLLITGGTGFVGLALADHAAASGIDVALFGDRPPPPSLLPRIGTGTTPCFIGDIRRVEDSAGAIADFKPTHIVHAAAITSSVEEEASSAPAMLSVNVAGTAALIRAAADAAVERVVVLSSIAVHGDKFLSDGPLGEDHATQPGTVYGISKLAAEMVARRLASTSGLDIAIIRVGPVFGPFEYETGLRPIMSPHLQMVRAASAGIPASLSWALRADWIYSRDVAAGILAILQSKAARNETFNLAGGSVTDLLRWGELLSLRFPGWHFGVSEPGSVPSIRYGLIAERPMLDMAKIERVCGFSPHFGEAEAFADFMAWRDALE